MQDVNPTTQRNHRLKRRKPSRTSLRLTVRKGTMGLGRDIALGIVNLTDEGIGFRSRQELVRGDEVEIVLTHVGQNRVLKTFADVRWSCALPVNDDEDPVYVVGAKLRKRIPYADLTTFC